MNSNILLNLRDSSVNAVKICGFRNHYLHQASNYGMFENENASFGSIF